jgi:hypothetical protein
LQRYKGLSDKSITEFKDQRRHPDRREGAQESSNQPGSSHLSPTPNYHAQTVIPDTWFMKLAT